MTTEDLLNNQDILIDFVFGNLSQELDCKIKSIIEQDAIISNIVDDLYFLSCAFESDAYNLKVKLRSLHSHILDHLDDNKIN